METIKLDILRSEIPRGGFGRHLTNAECSDLRRTGISCSRNWIVIRSCDSENHGLLYYPYGTGYNLKYGVIVRTI